MKIETASIFEYSCQETITYASMTKEGLYAQLSERFDETFESDEEVYEFLERRNDGEEDPSVITFETVEVK